MDLIRSHSELCYLEIELLIDSANRNSIVRAKRDRSSNDEVNATTIEK